MQPIDMLGSIAGCLTTLAFLPQVILTWRHRSAGDLSLAWLGAFSVGILLWAVYGWVMGSVPIVATNVVTLVLVTSLTGFKVRDMLHERRRRDARTDLGAMDTTGTGGAPGAAHGIRREPAPLPATLPRPEGEPAQ